MARKWWFWAGLTVLVVIVLVFGVPLTHSPRHDTLEPYLKPGTTLAEFQQVAERYDIPLQYLGEDQINVNHGHAKLTLYTIPLDGSKWGQSLELSFRESFGLWSVRICHRSGKIGPEYWLCGG